MQIRKILIFGIMVSLVLTAIVPIINASDFKTTMDFGNEGIQNQLLSTHRVLAEEGTATWCGYCPGASAQLYQCYTMGLDFSIVTLVADKNSYANSRCGELGITGYPTVAFDGGYTKIVGLQTDYTTYYNAIINCGNRAVANINLNLHAYWMGGGQIFVTIGVTNNGGSTYNGHLHVYVTEKTSRWNDASGTPYHFAMINNYAINQGITVSSSSTQTYSNTWSGYTDISMSNIKVIASVFSPTYTDETVEVNPENPNSNPPSTPSTPSGPSTGIVGIPNTYSTSSTEPNGDTIKYGWDWDGDGDVDEWTDYYSSGATANTDHAWDSTGTYNVKVKAQDQFGTESGWSSAKSVQITIGTPPNTPSTPAGQTNGMHKTQYTYSTSTTDPNAGDKIYYWFDWGDGTNSGWKGPYDSGATGSASHKWNNAGNFDVKVKAKDLAGSETAWSPALSVYMGNTKPGRPSQPSGPVSGIISKTYTYSTSASDPEGDSLQYKFDWGDGTSSSWSTSKSADHIWYEEGTYKVKAKAKDSWDESDWSMERTVEIFSGDLDVSASGPYDGTTNQPIGFKGTVSGGIEPYTWSWSFGDDGTSTLQNPTHTYTAPGEYSINLYVSDSEGSEGVDTTTAVISSNPPNKPTINGPSEGGADKEIDFIISTSDPDGDNVFYWVEWYDGDPDGEWDGPYASGEDVTFNNIWTEKGDYTISVKAKDIYDEESDWETLPITVSKSKSYRFRFFELLQELFSRFPIMQRFLKI